MFYLLCNMATATPKPIEVAAFEVALLKSGETIPALAPKAGLTLIGLRTQRSKGFPSLATRRRLEAALRQPIWTSAAEWEQRQQCLARHAFDPGVLTVPQLRTRARELRLRGRSKARCRAEVVALFFAAPPQSPTIVSNPTPNE